MQFHSPVAIHFGYGNFEKYMQLYDEPTTLILTTISKKNLLNLKMAQVEIIPSLCSTGLISKLESTYRQRQIKCIIGLGGGAIMDTAKSLCALLNTEHQNILELSQKVTAPPLLKKIDLLLVPTTSGTGSECSKAAIIINDDKQERFALRGDLATAKIAIVDPLLNQTCPYQVRQESGFDAFAHAVETFISKKSDEYIRQQSIYILKLLSKNLPVYLNAPEDSKASEAVALASMLAGINLYNSSTCLPHRIQYAISNQKNVSHGLGLRLVYPAWIDVCSRVHSGFNHLAEGLGIHNFKEYYQSFVENISLIPESPFLLKNATLASILHSTNGNLQDDPGYTHESLISILEKSFKE